MNNKIELTKMFKKLNLITILLLLTGQSLLLTQVPEPKNKRIPEYMYYKSRIRHMNLEYTDEDLSSIGSGHIRTTYGEIFVKKEKHNFTVSREFRRNEVLNVDTEDNFLSIVGYSGAVCTTTIFQNMTKVWHASFFSGKATCRNMKINWIQIPIQGTDQEKENILVSTVTDKGDFYWFLIEDVEKTPFTNFNVVEADLYSKGILEKNEHYEVKFLSGHNSQKNVRILIYQRTDNLEGKYPENKLAFITSRNRSFMNGDSLRLTFGEMAIRDLHPILKNQKIKNIQFKNDFRRSRSSFGIFVSAIDEFNDENLYYFSGSTYISWTDKLMSPEVYLETGENMAGHCFENFGGSNRRPNLKSCGFYKKNKLKLCQVRRGFEGYSMADRMYFYDRCYDKEINRNPGENGYFLDKMYSTGNGIVVSKFRARGNPDYQFYSVDSFNKTSTISELDFNKNFYVANEHFIFEVPKKFEKNYELKTWVIGDIGLIKEAQFKNEEQANPKEWENELKIWINGNMININNLSYD